MVRSFISWNLRCRFERLPPLFAFDGPEEHDALLLPESSDTSERGSIDDDVPDVPFELPLFPLSPELPLLPLFPLFPLLPEWPECPPDEPDFSEWPPPEPPEPPDFSLTRPLSPD